MGEYLASPAKFSLSLNMFSNTFLPNVTSCECFRIPSFFVGQFLSKKQALLLVLMCVKA